MPLPLALLHPAPALPDNDGGVTLHFTAGAHPPVKARLLVGADGSQSGVRAQLFDDGPPLFAGEGAMEGLLTCSCSVWWVAFHTN